MSELTKFPTWLRSALGLRDAELPTQLETSAGVLPVTDVMAAGIRHSDAYRFATFNPVAGPFGVTEWLLLDTGELVLTGGSTGAYAAQSGLICYVSITSSGGAAQNIDSRIWTKPPNDVPSGSWLTSTQVLNGGQALGHLQLTGSGQALYLAPGQALNITAGGVAAGQTLYARAQGIRIPAEVFDFVR